MKLPQLSLRDVFWLVAFVAMGCGWWVRERALRNELVRKSNELMAERQRHAPLVRIDTDTTREYKLTNKMVLWLDKQGRMQVEYVP